MAKSIGVRLAFIITALVSGSLIAKASSLKGNWEWSEHISPGDSSIQRLEFLDNHGVAGFSFLPHVFSGSSSGGVGEALESEEYKYKMTRGAIVFTSANGFGSGWPGRHGMRGRTERCGFNFCPTRDQFKLSNCDLAGDWHLISRK